MGDGKNYKRYFDIQPRDARVGDVHAPHNGAQTFESIGERFLEEFMDRVHTFVTEFVGAHPQALHQEDKEEIAQGMQRVIDQKMGDIAHARERLNWKRVRRDSSLNAVGNDIFSQVVIDFTRATHDLFESSFTFEDDFSMQEKKGISDAIHGALKNFHEDILLAVIDDIDHAFDSYTDSSTVSAFPHTRAQRSHFVRIPVVDEDEPKTSYSAPLEERAPAEPEVYEMEEEVTLPVTEEETDEEVEETPFEIAEEPEEEKIEEEVVPEEKEIEEVVEVAPLIQEREPESIPESVEEVAEETVVPVEEVIAPVAEERRSPVQALYHPIYTPVDIDKEEVVPLARYGTVEGLRPLPVSDTPLTEKTKAPSAPMDIPSPYVWHEPSREVREATSAPAGRSAGEPSEGSMKGRAKHLLEEARSIVDTVQDAYVSTSFDQNIALSESFSRDKIYEVKNADDATDTMTAQEYVRALAKLMDRARKVGHFLFNNHQESRETLEECEYEFSLLKNAVRHSSPLLSQV